MHPVGFSAFNCLLDSQCSLLTSQILGSCSKLKWSNRAYAVYWLRGTLLYPWPGGLLGGIQPILKDSQFTGAEGGGNHCTADNETEKLGLDLAVFNAFE